MKSASPPVDALRLALQVVLGMLVVGGLVLGGIYLVSMRQASSLQVRVLLDNRCELFDDAFMAVSVPDGQRAYFVKGVAILNTRSDARVMVRSSDRFPDFDMETGTVKAAPEVVIVTRCGDRIDRTMDAMREQFKVDRR